MTFDYKTFTLEMFDDFKYFYFECDGDSKTITAKLKGSDE